MRYTIEYRLKEERLMETICFCKKMFDRFIGVMAICGAIYFLLISILCLIGFLLQLGYLL